MGRRLISQLHIDFQEGAVGVHCPGSHFPYHVKDQAHFETLVWVGELIGLACTVEKSQLAKACICTGEVSVLVKLQPSKETSRWCHEAILSNFLALQHHPELWLLASGFLLHPNSHHQPRTSLSLIMIKLYLPAEILGMQIPAPHLHKLLYTWGGPRKSC